MSRQAILHQLRSTTPLIAPSMLKCDFGNLQREVELLESADTRVLHWDVMDGHFVPNLSYGALLIESIRKRTDLIFDAHLMISEPERYLDDYLSAGCDCITFHVETVADPGKLLRRIREADAVAGLALNPGTDVEAVLPCLPECDLVLVMSVEPGFGGQQFMPSSLEKLQRLRDQISAETLLSIDGGIGKSTIGVCAQAGANLFVAGSAIFDEPDYRQAMDQLTELATKPVASTSLEQ